MLKLRNHNFKTLSALAQRSAALFNTLFQSAAKLPVLFEAQANPGNEEHVEKCLNDKHQKFQHICRAFNVERPVWRQQEERG